jgi:hypothetical protein
VYPELRDLKEAAPPQYQDPYSSNKGVLMERDQIQQVNNQIAKDVVHFCLHGGKMQLVYKVCNKIIILFRTSHYQKMA